MPIFADARIPVVLAPAAAAGPDDALLTEADLPADPGHVPGCFCCGPRGALARTLHRLFLARARGEVAWFRRVVISLPADAAGGLRAALVDDAFLAGRYRFCG